MLERALILGRGQEEVRPEHLPAELRSTTGRHIRPAQSILSLQEFERLHIERTLTTLEGNRTHAAKALGISRASLHSKIKLYRLENVGRTAPD